MPGKGARSGGLNIPYDLPSRVKQFLFFLRKPLTVCVVSPQLQILPLPNLPEFAAVQKVSSWPITTRASANAQSFQLFGESLL